MWQEGEVLVRYRASLDAEVRSLNSPNISKAVLRSNMANVVDESKLLIGGLVQDGGVIGNNGIIAVPGFSFLESNKALSEAVGKDGIMRARPLELFRKYNFEHPLVSGWDLFYLIRGDMAGSLGYEVSSRKLQFILVDGDNQTNRLFGELTEKAFPEIISFVAAKQRFGMIFPQRLQMVKAILHDMSDVIGRGNLTPVEESSGKN